MEVNRVLLDTSAYAAFLHDHPGVKLAIQQASGVLVNPIVLGELRAGFLKGTRRAANEQRLEAFLASPRTGIVSIDGATAERYAVIHDFLLRRGTPVATHDLWIAASAAQHGLKLLTLDGDFEQIPQVLVQRFEPLPRSRS